MRRITFMVAASLLWLGPVACGRSGMSYQTAGGEVAPANAVLLNVSNNNFADMDVYAVNDGGQSVRIGTVTGLSKGTFTLNPSLFPGSTLRIEGVPIGGFGRASSGSLVVTGGQTIDFTIAPTLQQSSAIVR